MDLDIKTTCTATFTKSHIEELLKEKLLKEGLLLKSFSINLKNDYSDPDCDRFGPDVVFDNITVNCEQVKNKQNERRNF